MAEYTILCVLSFAAILIALINSKISDVQYTIAITAGALLFSLVIVITGQIGILDLQPVASKLLASINFEVFLLEGVLGFLLFAGGLGVKLDRLKDQKWEITILVIAGTLISVLLIGFCLHYCLLWIGLNVPLIYCFLFGALISPTDPIAVLAIVKNLDAPPRIAMQIEGESLFNDGLGLVLFLTLLSFAFGDKAPTIFDVTHLFLVEAVGGIAYGFFLGLLFHFLISATNDHSMELLLTFAIPTTGYVFGNYLHVSGPLAMVVSGIIIGNWTRKTGFSEESKIHLDSFWELLDEFINGVLFLLIGLELILFPISQAIFIPSLMAIFIVLAARFISIQSCYLSFMPFRSYNKLSVPILVWGGLRGGLALAMALSIPSGTYIGADQNIDVKDLILWMTYAVVVVSILVQGSTISPLIEKSKSI